MNPTSRNRPKALLLPVLVLVAMAASGCRSVFIMKSTFESETVGAAPASNIPGTPSGDRYAYAGGGAAPIVFRDNTFSPTALSSWARFVNVTATDQTMTFTSQTYPASTYPRIWGYWTGDVVSEVSGAVFTVALGDLGGNNACTLELRDGNYHFAGSVLGPYTQGGSHTVVFTADNAARSCEVQVFQRGGNLTASTTYPGLLTGNQRQLQFRYVPTPSGGTATYGIDAAYISREAPEM